MKTKKAVAGKKKIATKKPRGPRPIRAPLTDEQFLLRDVVSVKELAQKLGRSQRHVWRLHANGEGPPIISIGPNSAGVRVKDYLLWLESRPLAGRQRLKLSEVEDANA